MTPLDIAKNALGRIQRWFGEFPPTGRTWGDGTPMSYGAAFGSNGERDYMRNAASQALSDIAAIEQQGGDSRIQFEVWATTGDRAGPNMARNSRDDDTYMDALVLAWWQAWQAGRASAATVAGEAVRWGMSSSVSLGCKATPHSAEETEARVKAAIANGTAIRMEGDFNIVINGAEHESPWWVICQHGFTYKFTQPPFSAQAVRDQALEEAAVAVEDVHDWTGSDGRSVSPPQEFCAEAVRALKSQPAPQGEK